MGAEESTLPGTCQLVAETPDTRDARSKKKDHRRNWITTECCAMQDIHIPITNHHREIGPGLPDGKVVFEGSEGRRGIFQRNGADPLNSNAEFPIVSHKHDSRPNCISAGQCQMWYSERASNSRAASRDSAADIAGDGSVRWERKLAAGAAVSLDREPVLLTLDRELHCLEVREHETLFPLAELKMCRMVQRGPGDSDDEFELLVQFAEFDPLVFQFDEANDREGFSRALERLAAEARKGTEREPMLAEAAESDDAAPALGAAVETVGYVSAIDSDYDGEENALLSQAIQPRVPNDPTVSRALAEEDNADELGGVHGRAFDESESIVPKVRAAPREGAAAPPPAPTPW
eukprot:gnl/TRDRNA2_/TRDRNA2_35705_c0_seq1.p1 gnl/TRDRNA2_/TRDRNA2_35705_c0~~gnl/TRDRNA2_/TRDRNA2_35705_c0_seq1.p1  ORF type:complete len:370 (+),score=47.83 gnl/TRDRNA2_/TRDRNA2_35705_c0_seq1:69-1112(+)